MARTDLDALINYGYSWKCNSGKLDNQIYFRMESLNCYCHAKQAAVILGSIVVFSNRGFLYPFKRL